jgi:hypothetical protein
MKLFRPGEHICLVYYARWPHRKLIHWHWPRRDIVNCQEAKDLVRGEGRP